MYRLTLCCYTGPAHAVYFGTYEFVKDAAGGNKDDNHHPGAAGTFRSYLVAGTDRADAI